MSFFLVAIFSGIEATSQTTISSLGSSGNWYSDDTRNTSGTDLVGVLKTQYGKPGQLPTAADDIAIDLQLQFLGGPTGSTGGGTVKIIAPTSFNSAKSTLSTVNLAGFAPASDLTGGSFTANYRWYMEPNPTVRTVAFRLGIQSTQWAASQTSFTAIRSGEQTWDLILVNLMDSPASNAWNDVNVDENNGTWALYRQASNTYFPAPPAAQTLAGWEADSYWGPILFGAGAKITNVQFGLGSSQQGCNAYVDYLQTTILNSGNTINFAAPVRVYSDLAETTLVGGYTTIQAAINDATTLNGYVVRVDAGTYNEKLSVNKSLYIRGTEATCILDGAGLGNGSGITITNATTDVSISGLTVRNHAGTGPNSFAGIYAVGGNNNLSVENCTIRDNVGGSGFYANGPVDIVTLNNLEVFGHTNVAGAARGIVIWNGLKSNITITNCDVYNNNCCGIELQDGTSTGVTMSNNNVYDNGDNGIGIVGMEGPGANLISYNTLTNNGRFGIEVKNSNGSGANSGSGSIVVQNNTVSRTNPIGAEVRDIVGIAVMRRGVLVGNVDVPTGVVVTGNTVSGYVQPSTSDGFGIVIGGTNHTVTGNTVSGNDVGIQQQAGHTPYPGDGDQSNLADLYFGRDNSPITCGNDISGNTLSNTLNTRDVAGPFGDGFVQNTNTGKTFCTITAAINDASTLNGHTLTVGPGTYAENVAVNKQLTLNGPNANVDCGGIRLAEALVAPTSGVPFTVTADNVTINGFEVTAPSSTYGINFGNTSDVAIKFNYIHDVGTTVTGAHVHAIIYTVANAAATSNASITDNCIDNISSTSLTGFSAAAIGILQSTSTGVLTGLNILRNTINDVQVNTGNWPTGKIANGISINVGGGVSYLTTSGEVVNAIIRDNEISNVSGFISTGIGLEGNTKNAIVENNSVSYLFGRKVDVRSGGGYDLSALKFENNRWVGTVTVQNNSFQTNTFTHDVTPGLGYAVSNYVPAGVAFAGGGGGTTGEATLECNWFGTSVYSEIEDNPALDGKVFNKDLCETNFVPFLVNGNDDNVAIGFQPEPTACGGGPVQVYNGNTFVSVHETIQAAIDAGTTLSGYTLRIATGTYTESVDAVTGGKNLIFAPGASPGCVTIVGDMTLNSGDVLEIEIEGTTPCTQHDQFTVSGTVTLGDATITIPAGSYFPAPGDSIRIIDGANPISGLFDQGSFVTDGNGNTYYIKYNGGADGKDVVLSQCCTGLLDLGIFNYSSVTPAGNKLQVFVKPTADVFNGTYSGGIFTIRTQATGVNFTILNSPYNYAEISTTISGGYKYFFFSTESFFIGQNWSAGVPQLALTLGYDCSFGNATFELINDGVTAANNADYYQELNAVDATGIFYEDDATSPASVSITASNNGSVICQAMPIDLGSATLNGASPYTYVWSGPDGYSNNVADPAPFAATLASAGTYYVTVTDDNGCTATASTTVTVSTSGACVLNVNTTLLYPTITQAIDATPTMNGHTLQVPAGDWPENVIVDKELTILGANAGTPCDGVRVTESVLSGTTTVTIAAHSVTIDGFTIEGITGVSSTGFNDAEIINNIINALELGIGSSLISTASDGYTIQDNCIYLDEQTYDTQGFATNPTLAATQTPGAWYIDRYAPFGFVSATFDGDTRLKHSIDASACETCRPPAYVSAFYNTQGRKYDIAGSTAMSVDLYVPADWATTGRRMAGFWGTAVDGSNVITRYPIIEFTSDGSNPRFRVYDNGVWIDLGLPSGTVYGEWHTLEMAIWGNSIICSVGDLSVVISGGGSVAISNVILQGHNTASPGVTYDIHWDNFNAYGNPAAENAPTVGIALVGASGAQAVTVQDNNVSDAFYGYVLSGVVTSLRTTVRGGTYANLMQGVAVVNTLDAVTYLPSTVGVEDLSFTSFGGNYPALPAFNFHAGVYAFTGGSNLGAVVDIKVEDVIVSNTGNIAPDCAGLYFGDFSTGAGLRLNAEVNRVDVLNNKNRGVQARGGNALVTVANSEILGNGGDPYGTGGNDGFGVYAGEGADVRLDSNYIQNPGTQVAYQVTAMFIGVAPAASITAYHNHIDRNGNGELTSNTYPISQFMATCNWWGDDDIDVVDGLVDGNVTFVPYLDDDTDLAPGTKGFQPVSAACVYPTRWYVNDNALTDDVFTLGLGDDTNQGTKRRPFRTIGKAVMVIVSADSIYIDAGTYDEQVVLPNTKDDVHFIGVGPCGTVAPDLTTVVDFTGTVTGKPTLFDIAGDNTVIDGIHFKVNLTKLNSAIIASDPALDNITLKNNCIDPYQSIPGTNFGSYGNRNAISINYGGPTDYRVASGGVDNILVDNNTLTATVNGPVLGDDPGDISFRSAISVDEGAGTYTRNTFQSINHDILIRFNSNGPVVIGGSIPNANTFLGGGVQYSDPNAGGGTVTISHNSFNGLVTASVLRLQNNYHDAAVSVANNTLSNLRWGMSIENFPNVTVAVNTFSPLTGYTDFRHITVNTKSISGNSASIVQVPIDGTFTGNTFNSLSPTVGGTAMAFYNHDSDNDSYDGLDPFTVGTPGSPNVFAKHFTWAVYLGDQTLTTTDLATLAIFPEYNLGAGSNTQMACWEVDIDIRNNTFDVDLGSGQQLPAVMSHAERLELEDILYHLPDNPCLGELIYFLPVEVMAKVFLQGPFDSAATLMKDDLRAAGLVPLTEPYSTINSTVDHIGSFPEVNNFVTETTTAGVLAVTGPNAIVDWVWLELRTDATTVQATRCALVQRDGDIVDMDGTSPVEFPDSYAGQYFLMVRHRNHLAAMTAALVDFSTMPTVNFTSPSQATYGTTSTSARRLIKTNTYGLWAGNTWPKSPTIGYAIRYNGTDNDRARILTVVGPTTPLIVVSNVYALEDVNMDTNVKYNGSNNDRAIILVNVGPTTPLNTIYQEPNN